jgi:hypothetical protein
MALLKTAFPQNKGVRTVHIGYDAAALRWKRCRDVLAGTDAIKASALEYLPKLNDQTVSDYNAMVLRANFFNASARTVNGLVGMLFRKAPTFTMPDALAELLKDIDLEGTPIDVLANDVCQEILTVGDYGLLVDYPPQTDTNGAVLTVGLAQQKGLRPVIKTYCIENIINWRYKLINNKNTLCQVVLQEPTLIPLNEFEQTQEMHYRVLDLDDANQYRVRVFKIDERGNDIVIEGPLYPLMDGKPLNFIPFEFMNDDQLEEPVLLDLFDINLSHFRTSADYEHGCHFTGLPMLYVFGITNVNDAGVRDPIYLGSSSALVDSNSDAKAGFVEFTGKGLETLENNLDRKEQQMAVLGARMLAAEKKQAETATTSAIHRTGENSILANISIETSLKIVKVITWFAEWAGIDTSDIDYQINRDFLPVATDGPTLLAYVQSWQAGVITDEELFDLLQRGDIIEADVEFDKHKLQLAAEQVIKQQQAVDQATKIAATQTKPEPLNPQNPKNPTNS